MSHNLNATDIIDYIDSDEFREILRTQVLEYEVVNGQKYVTAEFALKLESTDPYDLIDKVYKQEMQAEMPKEGVALWLFNIHVKKAMKEEIAKINGDVTSEAEQHFKIIESFGFKKIFEKEYDLKEKGLFEGNDTNEVTAKIKTNHPNKTIIEVNPSDFDGHFNVTYIRKEKEIIYHHKETGMMYHADTYGGVKINSANIYLQGSILDYDQYTQLESGRNYINYTENHMLTVNVKDLMAAKIETIMKCINLDKNWKAIDLNFYSYLSHKKENTEENYSWDQLLKEKIETFPLSVLNQLFEEIVMIDNPLLIDLIKEKNIRTDFLHINTFIKNLSDDDIKTVNVRNYIFDANFSSNYNRYLPENVIEQALQSGITKDRLEKFGTMFRDEGLTRFKTEKYNPSQDNERIIKEIHKLSADDLVLVKKVFSRGLDKEIKEILDNYEPKIPKQTHSIKKTLH